jgi:hypothetical protein
MYEFFSELLVNFVSSYDMFPNVKGADFQCYNQNVKLFLE